MILDTMFATLGGITKDIQKAAVATGEFIVEEVSSIPAAFTAGYDHGLMTSTDPVVEETPVEEPKKTGPFGPIE